MADPTLSQLIGGLLSYGPAGTAIGVLLYVIKVLYDRNVALSDQVKELALAANTSSLSNATALNGLTDVVRARFGRAEQ